MAEMMADDAGSSPKLSEIFNDSYQSYQDLDNSSEPTNSKTYQDELKRIIKLLEQATVMTSQLNLFSCNEELEEIATTDIRYLLLPALLGCLTMKVTNEERLNTVNRGKTYFKDYLGRCRQYGVTHEEIPEECAPTAQPPQGGRPDLRAMQANRDEKLRRYKETKEMEEKMKMLGVWSEIRHRPEEVQREYYILCLRNWVNRSLEELTGIQQEMEILQHMALMKSKQERGASHEAAKPQETTRKPMKPFVLTRDAIQAHVFGAGYPSVPTMTLEELYQIELEQGKILPQSQNPTSQSEQEEQERKEREKEEAVEGDDPEQLRKAREWDDWKDTHKRGCGNRENMG